MMIPIHPTSDVLPVPSYQNRRLGRLIIDLPLVPRGLVLGLEWPSRQVRSPPMV